MNQLKRVIRTERIWLKPHPTLLNVCHLSKNLFNEANFIVRQAFFSEGAWIKVTELQQRLKKSTNFKTLPLHNALKILQLLEQMWKSFFNSTADWKNHPEKYFKKPHPPKYKRSSKQGKFNVEIIKHASYPKEFLPFISNNNQLSKTIQVEYIHSSVVLSGLLQY